MNERICIVTNELFGPHKNGGIGTSQTFLAILLAENGFSVDILYTGEIKHRTEDHWTAWYSARNIRFQLFRSSGRRNIAPHIFALSHEIYSYLSGQSYDLVVFQDWGGTGYATTAAKRVGAFPQRTQIVTWLHSPELWLSYANRLRISSVEQAMKCEMERVAIEQSDLVLSPSNYMIDWLSSRGFNLTGLAQCLPLYIPNEVLAEDLAQPSSMRQKRAATPAALKAPNSALKPATAPQTEIVFFGRLERRKGVELFASAIRQLLPDPRISRITFLGRSEPFTIDDIRSLVGEESKSTVMIHLGNLDAFEAMAYIKKSKALVVIPSLVDNSPCVIYECLNNDVDFITTSAGGMRELIAEADLSDRVCAPRGRDLAQLISTHLAKSSSERQAARPRFNVETIASDTIKLFRLQSGKPCKLPAEAVSSSQPDLTVIMTHYERPHMLDSALDALDRQTSKDFRLILVDDASTSEAARVKLDAIERRTYSFPSEVVRKSSNEYLGAARNTGLKQCTTDLVVFIDDDNIAMPHMVEVLKKAMIASAADCVTTMMVGFERDTDINYQEMTRFSHWAFIPKALSLSGVRNVFGDATSIYKSAAIREVGGFHEEHGVTHEDWELHLKLASANKRHEYLPQAVFWYRGSADSMIRTTDTFLNDQRQIGAWGQLLPNNARLASALMLGLEKRAAELNEERQELRDALAVAKGRQSHEDTIATAHLKRVAAVIRERAPELSEMTERGWRELLK